MWWLFVSEALLHSWTSPFDFQTSVSQSDGRRGNIQQQTRWAKVVKTSKSSEQQLDFGISKLTVGLLWLYGSQTHEHALAASASDICFHSSHSHLSPSSPSTLPLSLLLTAKASHSRQTLPSTGEAAWWVMKTTHVRRVKPRRRPIEHLSTLNK